MGQSHQEGLCHRQNGHTHARSHRSGSRAHDPMDHHSGGDHLTNGPTENDDGEDRGGQAIRRRGPRRGDHAQPCAPLPVTASADVGPTLSAHVCWHLLGRCAPAPTAGPAGPSGAPSKGELPAALAPPRSELSSPAVLSA
eukprot:4957668-Pyramimonas_sp.AAC.1